MKEILHLISKDLTLELRQKYALNSILLYIVSTTFVVQLSFGRIIDENAWVALFWIIMIFAAFNAVAKSFVQESQARRYYYYIVASATGFILSKIAYNSLLMLLIGVLGFVVYSLFMGLPALNMPYFLTALVLGCIGLASALTMVSAIASRTGSNSAIMAVLGFPLILPLILLLIKATHQSVNPVMETPAAMGVLAAILLIDAVIIILAVILFPYLWRD